MATQETVKKMLPPYVPYKTFTNFLDTLKRGIPQRIDRSLMGSTSGTLQRQIMQALQYLNLITDTGNPERELEQLVHSEGLSRQTILKEILQSHYDFLFKDGIQLDRATASLFRERFEKTGASGDTLRKCMSFFLTAAKAAGIALSPHIKKVPSLHVRTVKPKHISQAKPATNIDEPTRQTVSSEKVVIPTEDVALKKMIFEKIPNFNPEWAAEVQKSWFDAINKLMDQFQNRPED